MSYPTCWVVAVVLNAGKSHKQAMKQLLGVQAALVLALLSYLSCVAHATV